MPFTILTVLLNGASSQVWENLTSKVTGNPGGSGISGLVVGSNDAETLPAQIDVAEILVYYKALSTAERESVVNWLNGKYVVF
jgi:hypothetical protein